MNSLEQLFQRIYAAPNEEALAKIVSADKRLSDPANWRPYGRDEGNFATFENQQPHPVAALVEKLTNSIDSILMRECKLRGIDPKSSAAPTSMNAALEQFFGVKNGIVEDRKRRAELAEMIQIAATGDSRRPNLTIYDRGEGQHPDDFERTFLSLHKRNKIDIQFVQGKYNQGSTGAVVFCGDLRYQLIGSKLDEALFAASDHAVNDFGFTLVRRHPFGDEEEEERHRTSWYEYLVIDEAIPRFPISELDLNLLRGTFNSGSVIKLYSYQLPRGTQTIISFKLWQELNQFLYQAALPMLVGDQRNPRTRTAIPLLGNYCVRR